MRATVPMLARKGRASYLGERSIGHQDPGATSTALIMAALEQAVIAGLSMVVVRGTPASPGAAIGPAWTRDASSARPAGTPAEEIARVIDGLRRAAAELAGLVEALTADGHAADAEIVETNHLMATDQTLVDAAIREAQAGAPAPEAILRAIEPHARALDSLDDPMLAARAADLRAVGRRAADLALGVAVDPPAGAVVVADDLGPGEVASWAGRIAAIVLAGSGTTAHAAIVARSLHVPLVTAAGDPALAIPVGEPVGIDADRGLVWRRPDARHAGAARGPDRAPARPGGSRSRGAAPAGRHHRRSRPAPAGERGHRRRGRRRARGGRRRHRAAAQRAVVPRRPRLADGAGAHGGARAAAGAAREPDRDRAHARLRRRQDAAVPGRAGRRRAARRPRHPARARRARRARPAAAGAAARGRRLRAADPGADGGRGGRRRGRARAGARGAATRSRPARPTRWSAP